MWTSLSLSIGLGLCFAGWLTVRAVARAWSFRPVAVVLLDVAAPFLVFLILLLATARPIYAGAVIFASFGGFAFADSVKRTVLREPIVFTDLSEVIWLFRHPKFYLPYAGTGLV